MVTATVYQSWDLIESQRRENLNRHLEAENAALTQKLDELEHGIVESSHLILEQRRLLEAMRLRVAALEARLTRLGSALFEEMGYCPRCAGRRFEQYLEETDAGDATFSRWAERPCLACNAPNDPPDLDQEAT